jgi:hypothetical protein
VLGIGLHLISVHFCHVMLLLSRLPPCVQHLRELVGHMDIKRW